MAGLEPEERSNYLFEICVEELSRELGSPQTVFGVLNERLQMYNKTTWAVILCVLHGIDLDGAIEDAIAKGRIPGPRELEAESQAVEGSG